MSCEMVCTLAKKAMDACKAGDYPRAIVILIKAHDICLVGGCDNIVMCKAVDYAIDELIDGDVDTAMKHLKKILEICN